MGGVRHARVRVPSLSTFQKILGNIYVDGVLGRWAAKSAKAQMPQKRVRGLWILSVGQRKAGIAIACREGDEKSVPTDADFLKLLLATFYLPDQAK